MSSFRDFVAVLAPLDPSCAFTDAFASGLAGGAREIRAYLAALVAYGASRDAPVRVHATMIPYTSMLTHWAADGSEQLATWLASASELEYAVYAAQATFELPLLAFIRAGGSPARAATMAARRVVTRAELLAMLQLGGDAHVDTVRQYFTHRVGSPGAADIAEAAVYAIEHGLVACTAAIVTSSAFDLRQYGGKVLALAAASDNLAIVAALAPTLARYDGTAPAGGHRPALVHALAKGNVDMVRVLIQSGVPVSPYIDVAAQPNAVIRRMLGAEDAVAEESSSPPPPAAAAAAKTSAGRKRTKA